jgi:hypothetical protein
MHAFAFGVLYKLIQVRLGASREELRDAVPLFIRQVETEIALLEHFLLAKGPFGDYRQIRNKLCPAPEVSDR